MNATTLRQLIAVDAALSPVHHAIDDALHCLVHLRDLEGVGALADVLEAFKRKLHDAHPIERHLAELQAMRAGSVIDLSADAEEPAVLPIRQADPNTGNVIDLRS
jgi:hypothetical protein